MIIKGNPTIGNAGLKPDVLDLTNSDAIAVAIVDGSGNQITSIGGTGGTSATDDGDFTAGSTPGTPAMGAYQSTPTAVTDGDLGIIAIDEDRNVKVNVVAGSTSGTEYTEGDTDTTLTGPAVMAEGPSNTATPLQVDASKHLQVDIAADSAGLATSANQSTVIGHVDGIEALLATIDADSSTLAGAVTGTEMQVDVVASLPAGTNAIGKLAANSGVDIGDVDVTSITGAHSADFDSGAGTDTTLAFGIAVPASGGAAVVPGDATAGLKVNLGSDNDVTLATLPDTSSGDLAAITAATEATQAAVEGTLTVSGTVTANLGTTDNAVLDTIASPVATVSSTPLMRVAIFDAGDGQITSFGGGTEYTEDAAAAADPVGKVTILVRDDSPVSVGADGDNVAQRGTAYGAAYTQIVDSSGNFVDSFGGSGGTAAADDADFSAGTTQGTLALGVYESSPSSVTDGDLGAVGITQTRALRVSVDNTVTVTASNLDVQSGGADLATATQAGAIQTAAEAIQSAVEGTLTVGSHAVTNAGAFATQVDGDALTALQLIDDAVHADDAAFTLGTSKGVMAMGFAGTQSVDANDAAALACDTDGALHVSDGGNVLSVDWNGTAPPIGAGTEAAALRVTLATDSTGVVSVDDNGGALTVDNAGAFAVQAAQSGTWNVTNVSGTVSLPTGASTAAAQATQLTALQLIDNPIVAHDAAVSGATAASMAGFNARSADPTAVASADATYALATLLGKQVVYPYAIPAASWSYASPAAVTDTADDVAKAAGGAGVRNYITGIQVINSHASTGTAVVIKDGSTVLWQGYAAAAGGGVSAHFSPPLRGTANTAVNVANITTSSSTFFNLQGFTAAE